MENSFGNRRVRRSLGFMPEGAQIGLAFFLCLFVISLLWNSGFSVMGVSKSEVAKLVFTSFWPWVLFAQLKILIVYLSVGYILGISAELIAEYIFPNLPGARFIWIFVTNAWMLSWNIKKYPQLYAETFYDRGGVLRFAQVLITDKIPYFIFKGSGVVLLSVAMLAAGIYLAKKMREKVYLVSFAVIALVGVTFYAYLPWFLPAKNHGPNIMVIAADSLRNDRLGTNNYFRKLTPNIDKVAARGTVFNNTYTVFPRTFPSVISMLTGQLPVTHGVRHMFPNKYLRDHRAASIAEALRQNGYATAVIADFAGDVFASMNIGFDEIKSPYFNFIILINQRCLETHFLLLPYVSNPAGRTIFPGAKGVREKCQPFHACG